jgi:hypothetical protein
MCHRARRGRGEGDGLFDVCGIDHREHSDWQARLHERASGRIHTCIVMVPDL